MVRIDLGRRRMAMGLAALAGCAALPVPAKAAPDDWATVLRTRVDGLGRIDFAGLARDPAPLDRFVAAIAATAPDSFVDPNGRLAYLLNSYNALAMWGILRRGVPERLSLLGRVSFFKLTDMTVGGRSLSLYDYENDVIRPIGDARVHFALNCMSVSCPRLPRVPFMGPDLDRQLEAGARLFFSEPRNLLVEPAVRRMTVSAILDFYTSDLLKHAPSLPAYVSLYHAPIPNDFSTRFYDYDWTINRQPGTAG